MKSLFALSLLLGAGYIGYKVGQAYYVYVSRIDASTGVQELLRIDASGWSWVSNANDATTFAIINALKVRELLKSFTQANPDISYSLVLQEQVQIA